MNTTATNTKPEDMSPAEAHDAVTVLEGAVLSDDKDDLRKVLDASVSRSTSGLRDSLTYANRSLQGARLQADELKGRLANSPTLVSLADYSDKVVQACADGVLHLGAYTGYFIANGGVLLVGTTETILVETSKFSLDVLATGYYLGLDTAKNAWSLATRLAAWLSEKLGQMFQASKTTMIEAGKSVQRIVVRPEPVAA